MVADRIELSTASLHRYTVYCIREVFYQTEISDLRYGEWGSNPQGFTPQVLKTCRLTNSRIPVQIEIVDRL